MSQKITNQEALLEAGLIHQPGSGYHPELDPYQRFVGRVDLIKLHTVLLMNGWAMSTRDDKPFRSYSKRAGPYTTSRISVERDGDAATAATISTFTGHN